MILHVINNHERKCHFTWDKTVSKKSSGIYKITSPSGRIYIGQSKALYLRMMSYMIKGKNKSQVLLYRSFEQYGIENHSFEILCYFNFYNNILLHDLESHYIRLYCSFSDWNNNNENRGLNLTSGGFVTQMSAESVEKRASKCRGVKKQNVWYKPTESHKEAVRRALTGIKRERTVNYQRKMDAQIKPVHVFNENGEFVNTYYGSPSLRKNGYHPSSVFKCCSGEFQRYNGFYFSYDRSFKPNLNWKSLKEKVKIYMYGFNFDLLKIYDSLSDTDKDGFQSTEICRRTKDNKIYSYKRGTYFFSRSLIIKQTFEQQPM